MGRFARGAHGVKADPFAKRSAYGKSEAMKVLVADDLSEEGIAILRRGAGLNVDVRTGLKPNELELAIADYEALAVRSATRVTGAVIRAGRKLKVIGRAGVGVDNIDLEQATKQGARAIALGADPNARPFYERMGAIVTDWFDSSLEPGQKAPTMRYDLGRPSRRAL